MYVRLRMPASAARQLNLAVDDGPEEVTVTLSAMELAGRLTVSTGRVVTLESIIRYCCAWSAASAAWRGLLARYGTDGLRESLRTHSNDLPLWPQEAGDELALPRLRLVLESHLLQSEGGADLTAIEAYIWGYQQTAERLLELSKMLLPVDLPLRGRAG
jgi:hypothetical protein